LLDNSSTHHGEPLHHLLRRHPRLHIEHFPAYAPELNPDEGVWSLAKRDLANSCPTMLRSWWKMSSVRSNAIRTSRKLRGCILQSELPSFFALDYAFFMQTSIGVALERRFYLLVLLDMVALTAQISNVLPYHTLRSDGLLTSVCHNFDERRERNRMPTHAQVLRSPAPHRCLRMVEIISEFRRENRTRFPDANRCLFPIHFKQPFCKGYHLPCSDLRESKLFHVHSILDSLDRGYHIPIWM